MSSKTISYLEFRKAAIRNITVCEILLKTYNSEKPINQRQILYKTYYLGGYVIEFLYKFSLFSHLNIGQFDDVYKFKNQEFQSKWKVHNYDQLNFLCEKEGLKFSSDIPYLGNNLPNKKVTELFDAWDVQIRYSLNLGKKNVELTYDDLNTFIETIKEINKKINSIYL